jgi:hypothetical protein
MSMAFETVGTRISATSHVGTGLRHARSFSSAVMGAPPKVPEVMLFAAVVTGQRR